MKFPQIVLLVVALPLLVTSEECGDNEVVVECAKPKWCNTCGIRGNCKLTSCSEGCDCQENYYRNDRGICISKIQCPPDIPIECGVNEVVVKCAKPKWCNTCGIRGNCKLTTSCSEGCDCQENYYRDDLGHCIPKIQCPPDIPIECSNDNEEYSECVNPCNDCQTRGKCNFLVCNKGCDCKSGFYRDADKKCINPASCPNETATST